MGTQFRRSKIRVEFTMNQQHPIPDRTTRERLLANLRRTHLEMEQFNLELEEINAKLEAVIRKKRLSRLNNLLNNS
ncbi:hypothetical protein PA905_07060 [Planktothrix agardhii CCAP 1459/11A]|jgi:hypothetical protein|uniref:Uncharacterized protein n=3 Tax=Microcoleaceae TaxID=1892252 RepID=A0A479ZS69_PLAAG|nr:hypothetical protein PA905_07060 [Planktothrix agardhii CCAP 1459/11A]CAC5343689.1 hypothetical protein PLAN_40104 [Planktothrix rubescens NIVA-CYA 18]CAD5960757.1 hypothetical protein NO108_03526 [Planktothrix rubescens]CAD5980544.1 hypothetical protein PCC7821_04628 [Planktothrix rubescens NIVA-CYA 18]CAH2575172.1 hypothetical protein PRNO82_04535 [Planktothrix rubescens]